MPVSEVTILSKTSTKKNNIFVSYREEETLNETKTETNNGEAWESKKKSE